MTSPSVGLSGRSGSGLLIAMVVIVVAILAVLIFSQSFFTSSVTVEADVLVKGDIAQMLASSAVQEAMAQLRFMVNNPKSPVFLPFRELVYAPDLGKLDLSKHVHINETRQMALTEGYEGYTLEDPIVEVVLQRHIDKTEYERIGIIKYSASVTAAGGMTRRPFRRVEVVQPFKTCLTAPPRPFCLGGVFVANASTLTDLARLRSLRSRFISANEDLWHNLRELKASAPISLQEKYNDLERRLVPQETAVKRTPEVTGEGEAMLIGCYNDGSDFHLASLDLARYLEGYDRKLSALERQCKQGIERAHGNSLSGHEKFIESAMKAAGVVEDSLFRIWASRNAFRYVTKDDPFFAKLSDHFYKFNHSYWVRRCQQVVKKLEGEKDINVAWKRFLDDNGPPRGIIRVENEEEALELTGLIKGKFVLLLGAGGANLKDFNIDDEIEDVVTVVASTGQVKVNGEVHCSIFLARQEDKVAPNLFISPKAKLVGNLHMWQPPLQPLAGTLLRREKYSSGITLDGGRVIIIQTYLHVALAPKIIYKRVSRK